MSIGVVTDSTADLPPDLAQRHGIHVVPLNVHFGLETFKDGVTIRAEEFYDRLQSGGILPTTSQPTVGDFIDTYARLGQQFQEIISVHISAKLSATYASAIQAKAEMARIGGPRIEVVDTLQASMALGWVAVRVAETIAEGADMDEAIRVANSVSKRARFLGLVETLEYLHKGGRIGKARALAGSLLRIKPILDLTDGEAFPVDRTRTRGKGLARIKQLIVESGPLEKLAVEYTTVADDALEMAEELKHLMPGGDVTIARLGPVVGTYLGPGMVGAGLVRAGD